MKSAAQRASDGKRKEQATEMQRLLLFGKRDILFLKKKSTSVVHLPSVILISNCVADAVVPFIAKNTARWMKEYEQDVNQAREPLLPAAWVSQLSGGEAALPKLQQEIFHNRFKAKPRM